MSAISGIIGAGVGAWSTYVQSDIAADANRRAATAADIQVQTNANNLKIAKLAHDDVNRQLLAGLAVEEEKLAEEKKAEEDKTKLIYAVIAIVVLLFLAKKK